MATRVSDVEADALFDGRPRDAQRASGASETSEELQEMAQLERRLDEMRERFTGAAVPRPNGWGGYRVVPDRVEFSRFQDNRLHHRTLYLKKGTDWRSTLLQP